ncbi:hypothetical protein BJY52DRAFT_1185902 [Lactarius psammicola]|nr:hypothetical protein BJY52DRAFT_1185902 [Lactarius psammicola]
MRDGCFFLRGSSTKHWSGPDTEDEEDDWRAQGIDVLEQFPLVQRQWDTVSQFRAQITYKATLSLRDSSASLEDVCSILLTLHLLESRPLIDVLTIFLTQRAKNLQVTLSRSPKSSPNGSLPNGSGLSEIQESYRARARAIFSNRGDDGPSLMSRILLFIQSDIPVPDAALPPELQMSTQHLLSTLPSASHFALLPSSIRSYRPYLNEWFSKAVTNLRNAAEGWFTDLRTLKEVWAVRSWFDEWLGEKELEDREKRGLAEVIDGVAHGQAVKILRRVLGDLQDRFRHELRDALSQLQDGTSLVESTPGNFLFQPVVPPSFDVSLGSTLVSAFRKYESALQRQVATRTPLLHKIVCSLEDGARALRDDSDGKLTGKLREAYAPLVEDCCKAILSAISSDVAELKSGTGMLESFPPVLLESDSIDADTDIRSLAFLSRLTETLHVSPFDSDLGCNAISNSINFRGSISALHEQSVTQWRGFVVSTVLADYLKTPLHARSRGDLSCQPSWSLMHALLSLSSYVHSVKTPSSSTTGKHKHGIADTVIRHFVASLVDTLEASEELPDTRANIWDLKFLRRLLALWTSDWDGLLKLDKLIEQVRSSSYPTDDEDSLLEQHILRTQILLAPLLPSVPSQPPKNSSHATRDGSR